MITSSRFWIISILSTSFLTMLTNLDHTAIHYWDEGFHAIVSRNLTKHPFLFTLYDQPWLAFDYKNWGGNHIWLHKPPLAMWKICLSYWTFGFNTFALRFPSAILATASVWITYQISQHLFDQKTGLIAAFLQSFNPFLFGSVHGYKYSDHIDISLLFWVELACWLLLCAIRSGRWQTYVLCGFAQGLAYLSKSYLALITFGIASVVWLSYRIKFLRPEPNTILQIRLKHLGYVFLSSLITIAPWTIYCLVRHPKEFLWEHKRVIDHLSTDVESWGATWDRPLFDYMTLFYPGFYAFLLLSVLFLIVVMIRKRRLGEFFILAWSIGVIVPHCYALTKTPSATMIGLPPLLICLSVVISRTFNHMDFIYTSCLIASSISLRIVKGGKSLVQGRDQFDSLNNFSPYIETNFWIIQQIGLSLFLFLALYIIYRGLSRWKFRQKAWNLMRIIAILASMTYITSYIESAIAVTQTNRNDSYHKVIGEKIQATYSNNSCFFIDDAGHGSHFFLMFYANRSVYQSRYNDHKKGIVERNLDHLAKQSITAGAKPYLVATIGQTYSYPIVEEGKVYDRPYIIYQMLPKGENDEHKN